MPVPTVMQNSITVVRGGGRPAQTVTVTLGSAAVCGPAGLAAWCPLVEVQIAVKAMVFASLEVQIALNTTTFASFEAQIIVKTTVFVSLEVQIIVKTTVFASVEAQIMSNKNICVPRGLNHF